MPIFGLFGRKNKSSAAAARERLQILISHERQNRLGPDFLPDLQREILDVVKKYVAVRDDQVSIRVDFEGGGTVMEMNVTLPEN